VVKEKYYDVLDMQLQELADNFGPETPRKTIGTCNGFNWVLMDTSEILHINGTAISWLSYPE
jgi:hypothetical protein